MRSKCSALHRMAKNSKLKWCSSRRLVMNVMKRVIWKYSHAQNARKHSPDAVSSSITNVITAPSQMDKNARIARNGSPATVHWRDTFACIPVKSHSNATFAIDHSFRRRFWNGIWWPIAVNVHSSVHIARNRLYWRKHWDSTLIEITPKIQHPKCTIAHFVQRYAISYGVILQRERHTKFCYVYLIVSMHNFFAVFLSFVWLEPPFADPRRQNVSLWLLS